ncbi:hypothetical protein ACFL0E_00030 [Nanoarchaeota archaeon]
MTLPKCIKFFSYMRARFFDPEDFGFSEFDPVCYLNKQAEIAKCDGGSLYTCPYKTKAMNDPVMARIISQNGSPYR